MNIVISKKRIGDIPDSVQLDSDDNSVKSIAISLFNKHTGLLEHAYSGPSISEPVASEDQIKVDGFYRDSYITLSGDIKSTPRRPGAFYIFDRSQEAWVSVETPEIKADNIRKLRDGLLAGTDWTQLPDVPESMKQKYIPYRQALRDITLQEGFPETVIWPEIPA